ncbi:AMP-binding protein [Plantactinospora sp. GCM10030261]|uniref:AMP-binding protein n=1 Tax=Plantactinospora sp. GCM10030261 TaxID=3273420 RepID=UPI00361A89A5
MQEAADSAARRGVTLADRVRHAATDRPDDPALIWHDRTLTWSQLDDAVDRVAAVLRAATPAATPATRVAIALPNTPDFAVAFFATLRAGLVAVPINPGCTAPELRHVLVDSGATTLICTEAVREHVDEIRTGAPALTAVHVGLPPVADRPAVPEPAAADPTGRRPADRADLAVLLYTAGTEGRPKGAMLTHRALLANHEQLAGITPAVLGPDDVVLLALPLFHAYGLGAGLGAVAYHGACAVLIDRFDPGETLSAIARHQVTTVVGVPSMFLAWSLLPELGEAMASVRLTACGAAPLDTATSARFTEVTRHPVFVGYGLTEAAPVLTSTLVSPVAKESSIGRPIPGVELRLVSADGDVVWASGAAADEPDDDGWELDPESSGTDPGQIVVRGENLFSGYWPAGRDGPDADGWWATGDIAYADADGDLFLVDRLGELILVNGFNVYPREVELVLGGHAAVAESAVVAAPHPYTGQTVKAYVVRATGADVTAEDLIRYCERQLARFKCPTVVEFVADLPHSAIGKVRKTLLRSVPAPRAAGRPTEVPDVR